MAMDQNRNVEIATFEKISDSYLNDLEAKLEELQEDAWIDKITIAELEEDFCALQAKAAVFSVRAEEVGVENFKEMMDQAEMELQSAKEEAEALFREELNESNAMLLEVQNQAEKLELLRVQFKNNRGLEDCYVQRTNLLNELKNESSEIEKEITDLEALDEKMKTEMQSFEEHNLALEYFQQEQDQLNAEVADISFKLHHRRSEFPLPQ